MTDPPSTSANLSEAHSDPTGTGGAYIPLTYLVGFLHWLAARKDYIQVITYDDLPWASDFDYTNNYPLEARRWRDHMRKGMTYSSDHIYVLLQHDIDSRPHRAMSLLKHEKALGIRSNIMVFNRRHDRKLLRRAGQIRLTDYPVDWYYLKELHDVYGFVVGYHTNAMEQAGWDLHHAQQRFRSDLEQLRTWFSVNYFSPHGGVRGPGGENNNDIELPADLERDVRWVHNKHTVRFDANYSDGGINNPKRNIAERDLRDFVRSWRAGGRYRVLTHPQYYDENATQAANLSHAPWYRELFSSGTPSPQAAWQEVEVDGR
jgi:hypothetical protein